MLPLSKHHSMSNGSYSHHSSMKRRSRMLWMVATTTVAILTLQHTLVTIMSADHAIPDHTSSSSLLETTAAFRGKNASSFSPALSASTIKATPLPAIVVSNTRNGASSTEKSDTVRKRQRVDGMGEPIHLGGRLDYNAASSAVSLRAMELLLQNWGIKSMIDVGCGRGWSTLWFLLQGIQTQCVEASPYALSRNLLPETNVVNHDYTRGPWWPEETVDVVWSTNFVQQVSRPHMGNYMATFHKAAILVVSFPRESGWHHVEVHDFPWWNLQFQRHGFVLSDELTNQLQEMVQAEIDDSQAVGPDGKRLRATDLLADTQVFLNPNVASLDAHAHLFPEIGCYKQRDENGTLIHRDCNVGAGTDIETPLDAAYAPPKVNAIQTSTWEEIVKNQIQADKDGKPIDPSIHMKISRIAEHHQTPPTARRFNVSNHVVRQIPSHVAKGNRTMPKVPVVVWPLWEFGVDTAESLHIETNGINESPFLELSDDVYNFDPNVVWVGDTGYAYGWNVWCDKFKEQVQRAQAKRIELGLPTSWPIYIVDWTDGDASQRCTDIESIVGEDFVSYSQRSIVSHRHWDKETNWVHHGSRINLSEEGGPTYRHTPLIVRTDTIANLKESLRSRGKTLRDNIEDLERPVDVTHLWPLHAEAPGSGVGGVSSNLRSTVSKIVADLGNQTNMNVYVGLAGSAVNLGRRGVSSAYIEALLSTKIIVVTQRDEWEDHYRLFEALISGALVFTDRMLSLPAGLKNGTSIVEFSSADELRTLVQYYVNHKQERVAIARRGRRVAMNRHRTWHRIEEVIFGEPLTTCNDGSTNPCPYVLHANETFQR